MSKLRRWRIVIIVLGLLAAVIGVTVWRILDAHTEGERELARAKAALDASDSGWQYADLVKARNAAVPPDEENASLLVAKVAARESYFPTTQIKNWPDGKESPTGRPEPATVEAARAAWQNALEDIKLARGLRKLPRGGAKQALPASPLAPPGSPVLDSMKVAKLLQFDALVSALNGDPNQAVSSLHAVLHVGRAASAEGTLLGAMVQSACTALAIEGLKRVLAWSEPTSGLDELQAALIEETSTTKLTEALRMERAWANFVFDSIENGTITLSQVISFARATPNPKRTFDEFLYRPHLLADHALYLDTMTQYIEVTKRPVHEWRVAAMAVPPMPTDRRHLISMLLRTSNDRIITENINASAGLRVAVIALACERFRRANGKWPETIPTDVSAELQLDPHDGQPLRLRRRDDGVVVYSVGTDRNDDGGRLKNAKGETGTLDVGFRLWDPEKRK